MLAGANRDNEDCLVTVLVITYNSAPFVLETLDSIKHQSYQNLELVISDDHSTDKTVSLCKNWLSENGSRFTKYIIKTSTKNTGIPKNCNRGLNASNGTWVKTIAGDDTLSETCISDFITFVSQKEGALFCFSNFKSFKNTINPRNQLPYSDKRVERYQVFNALPVSGQLEAIIYHVIIHGATTFYNREALLAVGGYDDSYPFIEDRPTYYRWLSSDKRIDYLDKETVNYRLHSKSVTNKKNERTGVKEFNAKMNRMTYELFYPHFDLIGKFFFKLKHYYYVFFTKFTSSSIPLRVFRRIWYELLKIGDRRDYNKLYKC